VSKGQQQARRVTLQEIELATREESALTNDGAMQLVDKRRLAYMHESKDKHNLSSA